MANIRTKGGFEGSDLYNDSQDLYTGIEHLRKLMLGKKLLSCKEPGHEFTADFSENGPNSGLAFGSLLEIQNIASAAEQIKFHEYAVLTVNENVLKYDEALSDVIYHVDNLKSQID